MQTSRSPFSRKKPIPPPVIPTEGISIEQVIERLEENGREHDPDRLRTAYDFTVEQHGDQKRKSGEPYHLHPLYVAYLLADWNFDETCVIVGLLHDVVEDTEATAKVVDKRFGVEVRDLVDGVTKIGRHEYVRRDQAQSETFRKLILASAKDLRVILVKLADRFHNMMTLEHLSHEARRRIAQETLEIYAPIAQRLGMSKVQGDLEDLAFFFLYPHQFTALAEKITEKLRQGREAREGILRRLEEGIGEAEIEGEISSRVKRYYSIYRKLHRRGIDISQLYDYLAFRVITGSVADCYAVLGAVHQLWRPVPGRFKDHIAMPKPNLYQSLHTTVVGDSGRPFEIQIRTAEMDNVAEKGIAAHWRYKEGKVSAEATDGNILWLRQLVEWQKEVEDPRAFLTTLKIDLYPDEVYVFTPKGDAMSFALGATPLDFAYRIHTELGHHCVGARVNGRLVPIRTPLQNGDIVEILTNPSRNPSQDWLKIVKTSRAKSKIRHWLNTQQQERAIEIGRRLLQKELDRYKLGFKKFVEGERLAQYMRDEGFPRPDDLYARMGFGKLSSKHVLSRVLSEEQLSVADEPTGKLRRAVNKLLPFGPGAISVRGDNDLMAFLAKCCNPLPGEEIVGYITRGRGISVHSVDCSNVRNLLYNPDREIEVEWARSGDEVYPVALAIETEDHQGMLARLTEVVAKLDSNIRVFEAEAIETQRGLIQIILEVRDNKQLQKIRRALAAIPGVLRVDRTRSPRART